MTTKLISANFGLVLEIEKDGKAEKVQFSATCPSESIKHPTEAIQKILDILNTEFGTNYHIQKHLRYPVKEIKFARPAKIKARRPISQDEFNRRVKEIVP